MSKWVGYAVSVNCGEPLGCYQGTILEADGNTITLTKAFRNGFPYPKSQVTLNAADIKDLKIIEARAEPAEQPHSTVAVTKGCKKQQRATVCENLQANPSNSGNQVCSNGGGGGGGKPARGGGGGGGGGLTRSKPIDIQARPGKNATHAGSYGNSSSTPKSRGGGGGAGPEKARRRNEACFGDAAHPALDRDFDFEGNLALFDKRALWEQMNNAHKPDLVRQADDAGKFRHDENVLGGGAALTAGARRGIRVPEAARGPLDYVTDDALCVPSVTPQLRRRLWEGLRRLGLADEAHTLAARAVADVVLRLVGGGRRLDPSNAHQAPTVVALVGAHAPGAAGLRAARLLASHGVRVAVLVSGAGDGEPPAALRRDLAALALDGVRAAGGPARLPSCDAVVLALHDAAADEGPERHAAALAWARAARAALVALEPPPAGWPGLALRAAVLAGLPAALDPALGRVYLADVAPPASLFADLGVLYRPPFGASSVLALHPAD